MVQQFPSSWDLSNPRNMQRWLRHQQAWAECRARLNALQWQMQAQAAAAERDRAQKANRKLAREQSPVADQAHMTSRSSHTGSATVMSERPVEERICRIVINADGTYGGARVLDE